jgi:broad specificity phosphatase PhoE
MRTPTSVSSARAVALAALLVALAGCAAPTTVYVVRHGEAWTNVAPPAGMKESERDSLTPKGREQAASAGQSLAGAGVNAVVCSPLGRTRETAALIQKELGLAGEPEVVADLVHLADDEAAERGMERAWKALLARRSKAPLVVVTHSDVAALLIGRAKGTPVARCSETHRVGTGSVTRFEVDE